VAIRGGSVVGTDGKGPPRAHDRRMMHHETITLAESHRHDLLADASRLRASRRARRARGPSLRFRRRPAPDAG
jgi:hypothetical protein